MDVQLVQENDRKPLAILFQVQEETYLADIRNKIDEEVSDIMPPGRYSFCSRGTNISELKEKELTLNDIGEKNEDTSLYVVVLSHSLRGVENQQNNQSGLKQQENKQSPSHVLSDSKTTYESFQSTDPKSVATSDNNTNIQVENRQESSIMQNTTLPSTSNLFPKAPKKLLQLRSPTTTEVRNLKIYTENEIKEGRGKDQAYKIFWNRSVKRMAKNRNISKREIYKRTNEEWRLHRSKLLVEEYEDMEERETPDHMTKSKSGPKAKKMKAATVPSNITRMKIASERLESLRAQIDLKLKELEKIVDPTARKTILTALSQLQMHLDASSSEMRKVQDTLRKNLKKREQFKQETVKET